MSILNSLKINKSQMEFVLEKLASDHPHLFAQIIMDPTYPKVAAADQASPEAGADLSSYGERRESAFTKLRTYVAQEPEPLENYSTIANKLGLTRWYVSNYLTTPNFLVGLPESTQHYCVLLAAYNASNKQAQLHPSIQAVLAVHAFQVNDPKPYTHHTILWAVQASNLMSADQRNRYQLALVHKHFHTGLYDYLTLPGHDCSLGCKTAAALDFVKTPDAITINTARDYLNLTDQAYWRDVEYPQALLSGTISQRISLILGPQ